MKNKEIQDIMTFSDASRLIGVNPSRITQLVKAGKLDAIELAGKRFVLRSQAEMYANSERKAGRPFKKKT